VVSVKVVRPRVDLDTLSLYLVTDALSAGTRSLTDVVASAIKGGVTCVQLREKKLNTRDFVIQAMALKSLLAPHHISLVINDRIDVALACGAHGVHLGQSDMPVAQARRLLPADVFIGWSVETMSDVHQSDTLAVDYLGVSPIFSTPTKTDTLQPWGLDGLRLARSATNLPLVAIGGIHSHNALEVMMAGADGLAVVSAICAAPDPCAAARELSKIIHTGRAAFKK